MIFGERQYSAMSGNEMTSAVKSIVKLGFAVYGLSVLADIPEMLFRPERSVYIQEIRENTRKILEGYSTTPLEKNRLEGNKDDRI